jgi:hypothetical protein
VCFYLFFIIIFFFFRSKIFFYDFNCGRGFRMMKSIIKFLILFFINNIFLEQIIYNKKINSMVFINLHTVQKKKEQPVVCVNYLVL